MTIPRANQPDSRSAWQAGVWLVLMVVLAGLAGPRVGGLLADSTQVVAGTLAIALPLGLLLGVLLCKTQARGKRLAVALLVALVFLPLYLHAAAWQAAFGQLGWWTQSAAITRPVDPLLIGLQGVVWVHGVAATPWVALIVAASLSTVDRWQEEAALLDASSLRVLGALSLRGALAGTAVAALWVAAFVAAEMTVTDLFRVRTFAEEIYTQAASGLFERDAESWPTIPAVGLFCGVAMLLLLGSAAIATLSRWAQCNRGLDHDESWLTAWRLPRSGAVGTLLLWSLLGLLVLVPVVNLAVQAGVTVQRDGEAWVRGWSVSKLASVVTEAPWQHRRDLAVTLQLGFFVATSATVLGGLLAWILRDRSSMPWLSIGLVSACLVVPGPLLSVGVIRLLNHPWDSPLAGLTWLYDHTLVAPWLVQMVRATPVAILILWPTWASVPSNLLAAARSEGAGWLSTLLRVAVPMRWRSVTVCWLATLAISIGELSATLLVMPPGPSTLTVRVFSLLHYGVEGRVAGISLCLIGLFVATTLLASHFLLKPPGARESVPWDD